MNVPKVETANSVTRIANIDALGGRQIFWDGTTAHVALDSPAGLGSYRIFRTARGAVAFVV